MKVTNMDYKLKAISNNIDNDKIAEQMVDGNDKLIANDLSTDHFCQRTVPVLFTTIRGVHLRKFSKSSSNKYSIGFCDLERWVNFLSFFP